MSPERENPKKGIAIKKHVNKPSKVLEYKSVDIHTPILVIKKKITDEVKTEMEILRIDIFINKKFPKNTIKISEP